MPPWWIPLLLLLLVVCGEARTWRDYRRRSAPSVQDAGSLRLNNLLGTVSLAGGAGSGVLLRGVDAVAVAGWLAWAGVAASIAGTGLRAWAVEALGPWFTLTIQVRPGQPVVDRGPYRVIRHPSYAGGELALLGVGLAQGNWLSPVLYVLPWAIAHVYRIRVEERAMREMTGARYGEYCRRTWRLVPFVW